MKKKLIVLSVMIALIVVLSLAATGAVGAANGNPDIFRHYFTVNVKPVDVVVKYVSSLTVHSGETVTAVYRVQNYSTEDWEVAVNIDVPQSVWVGATWLHSGEDYIPGTAFRIAGQSVRELEIAFDTSLNSELALPVGVTMSLIDEVP